MSSVNIKKNNRHVLKKKNKNLRIIPVLPLSTYADKEKSAMHLYKMPVPEENFHDSGCENLGAQIRDQKDHFHPCALMSMCELHSSHVYQEQEKLPVIFTEAIILEKGTSIR